MASAIWNLKKEIKEPRRLRNNLTVYKGCGHGVNSHPGMLESPCLTESVHHLKYRMLLTAYFSLLSYKFYYLNKCSGIDKILLIFGQQGILSQYSIYFL